ncbi:hypothetical protein FACS1894191_2860 [Clostridia bacterium]|nr:hypothetical protein FACS1894191_2860 [Clostridia bacterium]
MLDTAQLDELSRNGADRIDRNALIDIKTVKIDISLPIANRMLSYLEQIKNPYCFLCGETPVKIRFSDTGKTLDEAIKGHFLGLKAL